MKQIIIALLLFVSFAANAQRTNEMEFRITQFKIKNEQRRQGSYTDNNSRIKIYKENGIEHLDIFDCCGWTMHGTLENNELPSTDLAATSTQFRTMTLNKTWKLVSTFHGDRDRISMYEINFKIIFRTNNVYLYMIVEGGSMEYDGILVY